jgi:hypothetical protein
MHGEKSTLALAGNVNQWANKEKNTIQFGYDTDEEAEKWWWNQERQGGFWDVRRIHIKTCNDSKHTLNRGDCTIFTLVTPFQVPLRLYYTYKGFHLGGAFRMVWPMFVGLSPSA